MTQSRIWWCHSATPFMWFLGGRRWGYSFMADFLFMHSSLFGTQMKQPTKFEIFIILSTCNRMFIKREEQRGAHTGKTCFQVFWRQIRSSWLRWARGPAAALATQACLTSSAAEVHRPISWPKMAIKGNGICSHQIHERVRRAGPGT